KNLPNVGSADDAAVHLAERIREQFQPGAVRVPEVEGGAALLLARDARLLKLPAQVCPPLGRHRDGDVVQSSQHLGIRAEVQPGQVEEGQQVAVADVEEEMAGAAVVPVLDQFGQ